MACLVDLQKRGGLTLDWTHHFAKRQLFSERPELVSALFKSVGKAVHELMDLLRTGGKAEFDPFVWLNEANWPLPSIESSIGSESKEEKERKRKTLLKNCQRSYLNGFRSLARASGVQMRQVVQGTAGGVVWQGYLACSENRIACGRCDDLLRMTQSLLEVFRKAASYKQDSVRVYDLIRQTQMMHPQKRFLHGDLKALLRLLSAMSLVGTHPQLAPMSYVLAMHDLPIGLDEHPELIIELNDVSGLAETRAFAMEVFANLPEAARDNFIKGYFSQSSSKELKSFLEGELGNIEANDEGLADFIAGKREQLRATEATKFFAVYENSQEPVQWEAMRHPFDQHLLVNAGPGAGKTTVLVGRIAHLIREQRVKPSEIVVLAFNRDVVFEIKKRIRNLFKSLGYAAYVQQVRISTFHSLALRSLFRSENPVEKVRGDSLLSDFAAKLASDFRFREQVAAGCRCILVDEFQDVTKDVYSIVRNIYHGSGDRAGVMVIGDDDQDILRWHRCKDGAVGADEFAEIYFDRFKREFGGEKLSLLDLAVNFRSGPEIVSVSQDMISSFFLEHTQSRRLKTSNLKEKSGAPADRVEQIDCCGKSWDEIVDEVAKACSRLLAENPGSLAVLCRSNGEVARVFERLAQGISGLAVQGGANMRIAVLRHVALWIDFLEAKIAEQDRSLNEALKQELISEFRQIFLIPENSAADVSDVGLSVLWDLCCEEQVFPHLSSLVRFLEALKLDELQRLQGVRRNKSQAIVSTIHKVKGLEYDNVVVVPSKTLFGKRGASSESLEKDAAEEARLLYVAMTRAKTRLINFMSDRECSWIYSPSEAFLGERGQSLILEGDHDEVGLGWAMQKSAFNPDPDDCQRYIEEEVGVGDTILLGGVGAGAYKGLVHRSQSGRTRQVGFLSLKSGVGNGNADLKVSAVVRFRPDERDLDRTGQLVAGRGWGYVVLVAGRLR